MIEVDQDQEHAFQIAGAWCALASVFEIDLEATGAPSAMGLLILADGLTTALAKGISFAPLRHKRCALM